MRLILFICLILLTLSHSLSSQHKDTTFHRTSKEIKTYNGNHLTTSIKYFDKNGVLLYQANYDTSGRFSHSNNKLDSAFYYTYHHNGKLKTIIQQIKEEQIVEKEYDSTGFQIRNESYQYYQSFRDTLVGNHSYLRSKKWERTRWYSNGQLKDRFRMINKKLIGIQEGYFPDGSIQLKVIQPKYDARKDTFSIQYYNNKQIKQIEYFQEKDNYVYKYYRTYFEDGSPDTSFTWKRRLNNENWNNYYKAGLIDEEKEFVGDSVWTIYSNSGHLIFYKRHLHGYPRVQRSWHSNGEQKYVVYFANNQIMYFKKWYQNGEPKIESYLDLRDDYKQNSDEIRSFLYRLEYNDNVNLNLDNFTSYREDGTLKEKHKSNYNNTNLSYPTRIIYDQFGEDSISYFGNKYGEEIYGFIRDSLIYDPYNLNIEFGEHERYNAMPKELSEFKLKDFQMVKTNTYESPTLPTRQVQLHDFLIQTAEVTNKQYLYFFNSVYADSIDFLGEEELQRYYPDTSKIRTIKIDGQIINFNDYFTLPEYSDYPVVGISWLSTKYYIQWLKNIWLVDQESINPDRNHHFDLINFRLPTYAELEYLKLTSTNRKTQNKNIHTTKHGKKDNFKLYGTSSNVYEWCEDAYWPTDSFRQNKYNDLLSIYHYTPNKRALFNQCFYDSNEPRKAVCGNHGKLKENGNWEYQDTSNVHLGFRVVIDLYNSKIPYENCYEDIWIGADDFEEKVELQMKKEENFISR